MIEPNKPERVMISRVGQPEPGAVIGQVFLDAPPRHEDEPPRKGAFLGYSVLTDRGFYLYAQPGQVEALVE
jgi:hypothetical protein